MEVMKKETNRASATALCTGYDKQRELAQQPRIKGLAETAIGFAIPVRGLQFKVTNVFVMRMLWHLLKTAQAECRKRCHLVKIYGFPRNICPRRVYNNRYNVTVTSL